MTQILILAFLAVILFLIYRYGIFLPEVKGLPVLMYHNVSKEVNDRDTVDIETFKKQMRYLFENGYTPVSFADIQNSAVSKLKKPVIITFDDAYLSFYKLGWPVLKKFGFKFTLFAPVGFIGKTNEWCGGREKIMGYEELKEIAKNANAEIGLHSYSHKNFSNLSADDMETDFKKSIEELKENNCPFYGVFAFPYGRPPRARENFSALTGIFKKYKIKYAALIKSRVNKLPIKNPYRVKRLPVRGDDSFFLFKQRLKKGRIPLF